MTSNPIQSCCVKGTKHEGSTTGRIEQFVQTEYGLVDAYISKPLEGKQAKHAIVYIVDVIGHESVNAQLLADKLAAKGYYVVMPDLFYGDSIEMNNFAGVDLAKWKQGAYSKKSIAHTPETVDPIIEACIKKIRGELRFEKVGAVGYCFGAKYVVRFSRETGFDAGYLAHPSFVEEEELAAITRPVSIAAAEIDEIFTKNHRHQSEQILKNAGVPWQINLFGGVSHGFAVRGDLKEERLKFAMAAAFNQAAEWFDFYIA